jgi:hypothetical protein
VRLRPGGRKGIERGGFLVALQHRHDHDEMQGEEHEADIDDAQSARAAPPAKRDDAISSATSAITPKMKGGPIGFGGDSIW